MAVWHGSKGPTMKVTPMEALLAMQIDFENVLDDGSLADIVMLWARMDENPPAEGVARGSMMARTRKVVPAFKRVPRRLVQVMKAVSQDRQLKQCVHSAGTTAPRVNRL